MKKLLLLIFIFIASLNAKTFISIGVGDNSDKDIAYNKAMKNAKIEALNISGVFIQSELEIIKHNSLTQFKKEFKEKIFQKSEGLVSFIEVLQKDFTQDGQIYICTLKAKFDVKKSDIQNSLEIMKRLDKLSNSKASKNDIEKLQNDIKNLQDKISNQKLTKVITHNTNEIINQIKIQNNIKVDVKIQNTTKIQNSTDQLLYFIVGGLLLVILVMLFLNSRKKDIVVKHIIENPTIEDIADIQKQDDAIVLSLEKDIFYEGEKLSIHFHLKSDSKEWYIYGYNVDDNFNIVPLDLIEDDKIIANKDYSFPTWSDGYDVSTPFGDDIIKIFVSNKKIKKPNLQDRESEIFHNLNSRGLKNTSLNKHLSQKEGISKYDLTGYYRGFEENVTLYEKSIFYKTMERRQ